jgi:hypothetical protein
MPLPPPGNSISISQIRAELGTSSGSLRTLSSLAGFSTPDAMSEFYSYSSESMNGLTDAAMDAYQSFGDWYCGCNENFTVWQTTAGRWLRGNSIGSTPLNGNFSLSGQIYSFSNGYAGTYYGTCAYIC